MREKVKRRKSMTGKTASAKGKEDTIASKAKEVKTGTKDSETTMRKTTRAARGF